MAIEPIAKKDYFNQVKNNYHSLIVDGTGLLVSNELPFLGAGPDGQVHSTCHEQGLLEIKCPFNCKEGLELWYTDPNC